MAYPKPELKSGKPHKVFEYERTSNQNSPNRPYDKSDSRQERHEHGKIAQGGGRNQTGDIAADYGEQKYACHHDQAISDIQILIFSIGVGGYGAGQYV